MNVGRKITGHLKTNNSNKLSYSNVSYIDYYSCF